MIYFIVVILIYAALSTLFNVLQHRENVRLLKIKEANEKYINELLANEKTKDKLINLQQIELSFYNSKDKL